MTVTRWATPISLSYPGNRGSPPRTGVVKAGSPPRHGLVGLLHSPRFVGVKRLQNVGRDVHDNVAVDIPSYTSGAEERSPTSSPQRDILKSRQDLTQLTKSDQVVHPRYGPAVSSDKPMCTLPSPRLCRLYLTLVVIVIGFMVSPSSPSYPLGPRTRTYDHSAPQSLA